MKKIILSVSIAAIFAACGSPKTGDETTAQSTLTDTAGLSEYKQWKAQQDVVSMEGTNQLNNENILPEDNIEKSAPVVVYRAPSNPQPRVIKPTGAVRTSRQRAVVKTPAPVYEDAGESTAGTSVDPGVVTQPTVSSGPIISNEPVATVPEVKEKKGWSKAAKGTAIGAGSGAVLGAIISKKKGTGAVIGGIVGAAGGYVLGRAQDKKDGRY